MSSNPFDLERAIDQLKTETPSAEATRQASLTLLKPKRTPMRPRAIAFGAVAVAAAVIFWPRAATSSAWAQVAAETRNQTKVHTTQRMVEGAPKDAMPYSETWIDGTRFAATMYLPSGDRKLAFLIRNDGVNNLFYQPFGQRNGLPPARAKISKSKPGLIWPGSPGLGGQSNQIDNVIQQAGWKVLEHQSGYEIDGHTWDRYRLTRLSYGRYRNDVVAYSDPETKLVRRIDTLGERGETREICEMEYPAEIPDSVFKPEAPPGVEVVDLDQERVELAATLKKGLGTQKKITLRALLQGHDGALWVLWTGGAPAGDLKYPVTLQGIKVQKPFGLKEFTLGWAQAPHKTKPAPGVGERLGGMALPVSRGLERVTVTIPVLDSTGKKKLGSVTFNNVPVRRIESLYDFGRELGIW